ncbi:MAG: prenyltransferase/squalene oxidase repeat-containing protein [Planctomycetota bacterium]
MHIHRLSTLLLALVATPLGLAAYQAGQALPWTQAEATASDAERPPPPSAGQIHDAIDAGLRWLRTQEQPAGLYGDLATTAETLLVFAESPRRYRPVDGPWFRRPYERLLAAWNPKLEAFDAGEHGDAQALNRRAAELLRLVDPEGQAAKIRGAQARGGEPAASTVGPDERLERARRTLAATPTGLWPKEAPELGATVRVLDELNQAHRAAKLAAAKAEAGATTPLPPLAEGTREELTAAIARGVAFLLDAQDEEGRWGFGGRPDPGITAMVAGAVQALPAAHRDAEVDARVNRALDWLRSLQQEDGSIHAGQLANYVTSASVMALARRNAPEDARAIARARAFLVELQADEGEGYQPADLYYGGVGYGGDERPDLSNMQMALEALRAAGAEPGESDTFQKALAFLEHCQNHSETNDLELTRDGATIVAGNDGGAGYAPGESKAGFIDLPDGTQVPRSYGSMTYALLKCYLFAGLAKDDPRVEAAWQWITQHYTLDVNPGFEASSDPAAAYQGLFYYFYTMAKALALFGQPTVVDAAGRAHDWRTELGGRLVAMQRQDGSWINTNAERWYEGNPILATAYALTTLDTLLGVSTAK